MEPLDALRLRYPWPDKKPGLNIRLNAYGGWLNEYTAAMLIRLSAHAGVILELGTWTGKSARFLCDNNPQVKVISIDHFLGSRELQDAHHAKVLPILYQACLHRCWEYRDRITIVKETTADGMAAVDAVGLVPDLIYVDASHEEKDVARDIQVASTFWPNAVLCGDDWDIPGVQNAVNRAAEQMERALWHDDRAWSIT